MSDTSAVKKYLAHWFQLGKKVICPKNQAMLFPLPIFNADRYSSEFEDCWQKMLDPQSGDCYLEGTQQTIPVNSQENLDRIRQRLLKNSPSH